MKKLYLNLMFICAFLWIALSMNQLYAQEKTELTVPDYSYGEVFGNYGLVTDEGRPYPGRSGFGTKVTDERSSGLSLAHGYRWWGYPSFPLLICYNLPRFNYPGFHGVWNNGLVGCTFGSNGYMGSWGGVIVEPEMRTIWSLGGANNHNGPTAPYIYNNVSYGIPSTWGYVHSFGYMRRIVEVQSTGSLQEGDPVYIKTYLESEGVTEGDGTADVVGILFLGILSESLWHQFNVGMEYLDWGFIEEMPRDYMIGDLEISLNVYDSILAEVAVGDILIMEIAFQNKLTLDNPGADGDLDGWVGERPHNMFTNPVYTRTDSIKSLIKKHGNTLTYDYISLTPGAVLEPVTPDGPNIDGDIDGISDVQEKGPDGNDDSFDGNTDGTPDFQQANVSSFHTYDGLDYVTMVVPEGTELSQLLVTDNPSPSDAPENADFSCGFFDFSIDGLEPGEAITVTLILHNLGYDFVKYYKYGMTPADDPTPHWYEFMYDGETGAEISGNEITLHFVDGLRGDDDITANGSIKEPGGPSKSITTGSPSIHETGEIIVYPNPAKDHIILQINNNIPANDYILKISSITGKTIQQKEISVHGENQEIVIGIDDLPNGVYLISLARNNYIYKSRFIKME